MKKSILISLFSCIGIALLAQNITTRTYPIGFDLIKKDVINAIRFDFGNVIYNTELDSANNTLFLELREISKDSTFYENSGSLVAFDLATKELKWSRKIDYATIQVQFQVGAIFLNSNSGKTTCLNPKNGIETWSAEHPFFKTFPRFNIAFGYKNKGLSLSLSDMLECVNLTTGATHWKRIVNKDFGWNGVYIENDSTIIVLSSGLQKINLRNGEGWNYTVSTGIKNYSRKIENNAASVGMNIISDVFSFSEGNNMLSQLCSNMLVDDNYYYYASKEFIIKITKSGTVAWKAKLPSETSLSELRIDSSTIYLINKAKADYEGKDMYYGKPYVAAFDLITGKEKFQTNINTKGNSLIAYSSTTNGFELAYKDRIVEFSNTTAKVINSSKFSTNQLGYLDFKINPSKQFILKDSTMTSLEDVNPTNKYFKTSKNQILVVNPDLTMQKTIQMDEMYSLYGKTEMYNFFLNNEKMTICNTKGVIVGKMNMGDDTFMLNNKLYEIGATGIIEVNTDQLK